MLGLWDDYWALMTAAVVTGVVVGVAGFKASTSLKPRTRAYRRRASLSVALGAAIVLALGFFWHGPIGTADAFAHRVEREARQALVNYEMTQVGVRIERSPLRRALILSGPADDFQRRGLVDILNTVPGVGTVYWADMRPRASLPLLVEVELAALFALSLGLLLAYLLELRRRYRAQWSW